MEVYLRRTPAATPKVIAVGKAGAAAAAARQLQKNDLGVAVCWVLSCAGQRLVGNLNHLQKMGNLENSSVRQERPIQRRSGGTPIADAQDLTAGHTLRIRYGYATHQNQPCTVQTEKFSGFFPKFSCNALLSDYHRNLFRRLTALVTGRRQSSRGGTFFSTSLVHLPFPPSDCT